MKLWLALPQLYELSQHVVTRSNCWKIFTERYLQPARGGRLLDLGCGTGIILDFLPALEYWGLDENSWYIHYAQKKKKNDANFLCTDLNKKPWPVEGHFDRVMATGLLHHLSDQEAVDLMKNVRAVLKPHGKFVTFDGFFENGQSPIARWLLSHDRGEHVRSKEGYEFLARSIFKRVDLHIERRLLRLPYSHLIMEMASD